MQAKTVHINLLNMELVLSNQFEKSKEASTCKSDPNYLGNSLQHSPFRLKQARQVVYEVAMAIVRQVLAVLR